MKFNWKLRIRVGREKEEAKVLYDHKKGKRESDAVGKRYRKEPSGSCRRTRQKKDKAEVDHSHLGSIRLEHREPSERDRSRVKETSEVASSADEKSKTMRR